MGLLGLSYHNSADKNRFFLVADILVVKLNQYLTPYFLKYVIGVMEPDKKKLGIWSDESLKKTAFESSYAAARFLLAEIPVHVQDKDNNDLFSEGIRSSWDDLLFFLKDDESSLQLILDTALPGVSKSDREEIRELMVRYLRAQEKVFTKIYGSKYLNTEKHHIASKLISIYGKNIPDQTVKDFVKYMEKIVTSKNTFLRNTLDNMLDMPPL